LTEMPLKINTNKEI
ncbi:unnamed protein product, partial [Fusarium fujikuroi]